MTDIAYRAWIQEVARINLAAKEKTALFTVRIPTLGTSGRPSATSLAGGMPAIKVPTGMPTPKLTAPAVPPVPKNLNPAKTIETIPPAGRIQSLGRAK